MLAEHDRLEVPEPPVMVVGLNKHTKLVELVVTARVTVPANPVGPGATVIVDVPRTPAFWVALVGLAVTVKSWNVKVTVVEFVVLPLVPVTVRV
jgi:hypothetical protein